ncbi:TetR/AcrR family transcriptional regulator [Aquidulcibacter sp.]|jgi:AcrR family transcriptional regulator|uniref:TetR/AcrR family transcriptional regulator n=1 Tax=Aquidulcibacter sp. TaxID=2052990 RepID=UPI0028A6A866|nr:TetR/AcrR family transcriptional regulator [Aquidulcibacter sp.]
MPNPEIVENNAAALPLKSDGSSTNPERSAATKAKLIAATIEALHRYGYAATTTILVAKNANVSRGAMLHHYPNKVALILACMKETYEAEMAYYLQELTPLSDPVERVLRLLDAAWECFKSPAGVARTEIWMATRSDADLSEQLLPVHRLDLDRSRTQMLHLMKEAGLLDEDFVSGFLTLSVATFRGLAMSAALGTPETEMRAAVEMLKDQLRLKISSLSWPNETLEGNFHPDSRINKQA